VILDKHGIFTWGQTALESYERMIANVTRAERYVEEQRTEYSRRTLSGPSSELSARVAPIARGALGRLSNQSWIASFRSTPAMVAFSDRDDLARVTGLGCATPDHVIRTKPWPLVVPQVNPDDVPRLTAALEGALREYAARYDAYFQRGSRARSVTRQELDPWPRIMLWPGLGALALGRSRREAEVAADIYEHTTSIIEAATALGGYEPVSELDLFDVEYWSLEQAKLKKTSAGDGPLAGKVALVTGAASGRCSRPAHTWLCAIGTPRPSRRAPPSSPRRTPTG